MKQVSDIGKKTKLYEGVNQFIAPILTGMVLVIDPSIGSTSSSPGWAIYKQGELLDSGTLFTGGSSTELWRRARTLGNSIKLLSSTYNFDLLIYEDIPATSSFNQNAVASLLKAVGIVLACSKSEYVLGIHPASWRNYVRPEYKKGDKEDAEEIGYIAIALAKHIITEKSNRTRNSVPGRGKSVKQ
jgi:hypothetical protein